MNIYMKKIIMLIILAMTVFSCELLNPNEWREAEKEAAERGEKCYRRYDGTVYCKDREGNRTY